MKRFSPRSPSPPAIICNLRVGALFHHHSPSGPGSTPASLDSADRMLANDGARGAFTITEQIQTLSLRVWPRVTVRLATSQVSSEREFAGSARWVRVKGQPLALRPSSNPPKSDARSKHCWTVSRTIFVTFPARSVAESGAIADAADCCAHPPIVKPANAIPAMTNPRQITPLLPSRCAVRPPSAPDRAWRTTPHPCPRRHCPWSATSRR